MPYTLILRSPDRADPSSDPNDFYIKTGLNSFLNDLFIFLPIDTILFIR